MTTLTAPRTTGTFDEHVVATLEALRSDGGTRELRVDLDEARRIQRGLADAGLAGLTISTDYGGAGLDIDHERRFRAIASNYVLNDTALGASVVLCVPTLLQWGTEQQRRTHLPPMLRADEIWCQLFSEPGAGSDLAAIATTATRTDDGWTVRGQKVWSSLAHESQYGFLIARTGTTEDRHRGLSAFIVDMASPGVDIRPIRQITGDADFNEVFLDDLHLPADAIIGSEGDGWNVARTMLSHERVMMGVQSRAMVSGHLDRIVAMARRRGVTTDPEIRQQIARVAISERLLELAAAKLESSLQTGAAPGPEGSILKLGMGQLAQAAAALAAQLAGPAAAAWDDSEGGSIAYDLSNCRMLTIAGGTSEIQRNIIGEAILGLPREPRPELTGGSR